MDVFNSSIEVTNSLDINGEPTYTRGGEARPVVQHAVENDRWVEQPREPGPHHVLKSRLEFLDNIHVHSYDQYRGRQDTSAVIAINWQRERLMDFAGEPFDAMWEHFDETGKIDIRLLKEGTYQMSDDQLLYLRTDKDFDFAKAFLESVQPTNKADAVVHFKGANLTAGYNVSGTKNNIELFTWLQESCGYNFNVLTGQRPFSCVPNRWFDLIYDATVEEVELELLRRAKMAFCFRFDEENCTHQLVDKHLAELKQRTHHQINSDTPLHKLLGGRGILTWSFIVLTDMLHISMNELLDVDFFLD